MFDGPSKWQCIMYFNMSKSKNKRCIDVPQSPGFVHCWFVVGGWFEPLIHGSSPAKLCQVLPLTAGLPTN